jgi:hypothetical protein
VAGLVTNIPSDIYRFMNGKDVSDQEVVVTTGSSG